jgi:spore maturation protein CgeB
VTTPSDYRVFKVGEQDRLVDIRIVLDGRTSHVAGRGGSDAEVRSVDELAPGEEALPVMLGTGLGRGLDHFLGTRSGPLAVVDKEQAITDITGARIRAQESGRVLWLDKGDPEHVLAELSRWQIEQGGKRFAPLAHPAYLRLDGPYYRTLLHALKASSAYDFWAKARYPKFQSWPPRVLLLTSNYFLIGELAAGLDRMSVPYRLVNVDTRETGCTAFVEELLKSVLDFRPDFILTINHLGVDREGVLMDLLERLELPLASWFVDNPHLILSLYERLVSPMAVLFTWDADNISSLRSMGHGEVHYLPLGTDATRFRPGSAMPPGLSWRSDISFVGNSMLYKVGARMKAGRFPRELLRSYRTVAAQFAGSDARSVREFIGSYDSGLSRSFEQLGSLERQLSYETLVTWESTRQYRKSCLDRILPFRPLLVGDKGWKITYAGRSDEFRWLPELGYYDDLPRFYPCSTINFNCTSMQMKGAVNQRVFDVPACGSFLITDHRKQLEDLFEPGKEVVFFRDRGEIGDLVAHYLNHPAERARITSAARARVLSCHLYEHRLDILLRTMVGIYGGRAA